VPGLVDGVPALCNTKPHHSYSCYTTPAPLGPFSLISLCLHQAGCWAGLPVMGRWSNRAVCRDSSLGTLISPYVNGRFKICSLQTFQTWTNMSWDHSTLPHAFSRGKLGVGAHFGLPHSFTAGLLLHWPDVRDSLTLNSRPLLEVTLHLTYPFCAQFR
jgi:hypothetical protein